MAALDARITRALTEPVASAEAQKVLDAALAEFRTLESRADALDCAALSPALALADAQTKRQEAADLRFLSDRLDAAVSALRVRVEDLREQEAEAAAQARREEAIAVRDELAADIAEHYPRIVRELTSLAKRIYECNALCAVAGVGPTAEEIGRGVPGHRGSGGTVGLIGNINLPMPSSSGNAWGAENGRMGAAIDWRGLEA